VRLAATLLVALAAAIAACGGPGELPEREGVQLDLARDRVMAAIEVERRLSSSPATAERLHRRVRKIVASGALEARRLDEFGLAALGELRLAAPSLVIVDRQGVPRQLDRQALSLFLDDALDSPASATYPAAAKEVSRIVGMVAGDDADAEIPVVEMTVDVFLADLAARTRPIWPDLAEKLSATRSQL
jgi:hypothetical protein